MKKTLNPNWVNEVGTSWWCDEHDLNSDGWLDPWNRPLIKSSLWEVKPTPEGWFVKHTIVVNPKTNLVVVLSIYNSPVPQGVKMELSKLLSLKFWFGGKVTYPFVHPCNRVQNALMIHLDGCCTYKFKVHKNGKLRCMRIYSANLFNLHLRPLQTITLDELRNRIALHGDKYSMPAIQMRSPVPIPVD